MRSWNGLWPLVEHALCHSTSLPEAAARVSEIRGCPTTWESIAKAWRRREDKEGAAIDLIGSKVAGVHGVSGMVQRLEQDVERYREGLMQLWQHAYESHDTKLQRMIDAVLDGKE